MFKSSKAFLSFSVDNLAKAKEFYGQKLGLKVIESSEGLELHPVTSMYSSIRNPTTHRRVLRCSIFWWTILTPPSPI